MSNSQEEPEGAIKGLRALAPIWTNVANENNVVIRCAQAYATAFNRNPAEPRLKDIADVARCSRNAVKDHLAEAKRLGMLSLDLRLPKEGELSRKLAEKYSLAEAVV